MTKHLCSFLTLQINRIPVTNLFILVPLAQISFVGAAFCLGALKGKSCLPYIKNNHRRSTSTDKQKIWALDLTYNNSNLNPGLRITSMGEGINRAVLTFKATHHIRGGLVRGIPPLSYCFRKPHVISEGRSLPTTSLQIYTPAYDPSKISPCVCVNGS